MNRAVWFHCFSGIAGDMALGALLDAGADVDEVRALVERLPVDGLILTTEETLRGGIAGTNVRVGAHSQDDGEQAHQQHRRAGEVLAMVDAAGFPGRLARRVRATFEALADVEGRLHGVLPADVHFHEVGAIDSIVDVVGTCAALEVLDVDEIHSSSVALGGGTVDSAHGTIPVPAPATAALLDGAPAYGTDDPFELTTPTGAALLAALTTGWGPMPAMVVEATGYGAGDRDLDGRPNLLQVVVGTLAGDTDRPGAGPGQPLVQLEANVDDATGETLAHTVARCLEVGAHDAWVTPIVMKKGRPAHMVSALCDPAVVAVVAGVLTSETGSLGVRGYAVDRWSAARTFEHVEVDGHRIALKVTAGRVKAEHDDAARVAEATGLPFREVVARAEAAWLATDGS
ncbi:MAG: nickel pincer cofactor biosynthesis protein LarC [Actinomycetota bacterium]|nr:nickel pincer cofactor biosynthesis protein LarC [Actinomycetota bacterium]